MAAYFQALSEPTRLAILNLLREGERNVGDIAEATGYTAANVSRHLSMLASTARWPARPRRHQRLPLHLADESVYKLCDLVRQHRTALLSAPPRSARRSCRPGGAGVSKVSDAHLIANLTWWWGVRRMEISRPHSCLIIAPLPGVLRDRHAFGARLRSGSGIGAISASCSSTLSIPSDFWNRTTGILPTAGGGPSWERSQHQAATLSRQLRQVDRRRHVCCCSCRHWMRSRSRLTCRSMSNVANRQSRPTSRSACAGIHATNIIEEESTSAAPA